MTMASTTPRRGRPPKQAQPTPSIAYTDNDMPAGGIPSRTPEDVYDDHQVTATVALAEQGLAEQVRLEAAHLGMTEKAYRTFIKYASPHELAELARDKGIDRPLTPFATIGESVLDSLDDGVDPKVDWRRLASSLLTEDEAKEWTVMWDRPGEDGYVSGWSKVKREPGNLARKARMGFSMVPLGPLRPPATVACDIPYDSGQVCPFTGYTPDEVEKHQKFKHREGYEAREARVRREREDRMLAIQQATLDAAQGKNTASLDTAGMQAQIDELKSLLTARDPAPARSAG